MMSFAQIFAVCLVAWLTLVSMGASEDRQGSEPSGANVAPPPPTAHPFEIQNAQAPPAPAFSEAPSRIGTNSAAPSFDSSTVSRGPTRSSVDGSNLSNESYLASGSSADGSRQSSDARADQNPTNAEGLAELSASSANVNATNQSGFEPNSGELNCLSLEPHGVHMCLRADTLECCLNNTVLEA